jgi:hypothetical protein
MSLQRTVRKRTLQTCIEEYITLKRGRQCRSNLVKDENGDSLADSHNILNRWKNYFSQLLNVHRVMMSGRNKYSPFEVEIAIAKLEGYKSPGSDQILAKTIQAGNFTF